MRRAHGQVAGALAFAFALAACSSGTTGPNYGGNGGNTGGTGGGSGNVTTITVNDDYFSPQFDTVAVGATVTWQNSGRLTHTTTSDTNIWDQSLSAGLSYTRTFNQAGTYPYHCRIHGSPGQGMYGILVVK
jgi:plastocyanin